MNKEDGGPAFPGGHGCLSGPTVGMSLRDYFATHANVGDVDSWHEDFIAQMSGISKPEGVYDAVAFTYRAVKAEARFRYMYADAMLAARSK